MINKVQDQFVSVFDGLTTPPIEHDREILQLSKTQAAGLDDLLSLEQCIVVAKSLAAALLKLKRMNRDSANLEEAEDMACGIVLNLAGEIKNINSYESCPRKCPCDSCAAARSDEAYDRCRDGAIMREE